MSDAAAGRRGIGLQDAVFLVFLALKLAEVGTVATWSWWWVTAPLWVPAAIRVAVAALSSRGTADLLAEFKRRSRR